VKTQCNADSNGDGNVDTVDFGQFRAAFGGNYGQPKYNPACDYNQDGKVDTVDFGIFRARFGDLGVPANCPPAAAWPPVI
jgi:uncharacterized protein (DUF2141 family)